MLHMGLLAEPTEAAKAAMVAEQVHWEDEMSDEAHGKRRATHQQGFGTS